MAQGSNVVFPKEGLRFLRSLKRNNNREWFQRHKTIYETAIKAPMEALIMALADDFARFAPEMIAEPRLSLHRIYRDTRFSKDKTPYKTHVAATFPRKGLGKHDGACFYLHLAPNEALVAGGVYMPLPEHLRAIRSHIAAHPGELERIVGASRFRKMFGPLSGEQLARVPRGFAPDHPSAGYLRLKQFLVSRTFEADQACRGQFYKIVVETFKGMLPLVRFLNEPVLRARRARERHEAVLGGL